jgi:phosphomannomutase
MESIRFGTDGWRALIAEQFTFDNCSIVAQATAAYFKEASAHKKLLPIAVSFDHRFLSEQFARLTAGIFQQQGFPVILSAAPTHTPVLSYAVVHRRCAGGIMITASHNPWQFNGFKIKLPYGAAATTAETQKIEAVIKINAGAGMGIPLPARSLPSLKTESFIESYLAHVRQLIDIKKINKLSARVVIDSMHGSGAGIVERLLNGSRLTIAPIRSNRDPMFGGVNPEPINDNIHALITAVQSSRADIGIAFDGDADRIGLVDAAGNFVNSHQIFALLLKHVHENRSMKGAVVKTISGTYMINRLGHAYGLDVIETPIGFKNITEQMLKTDVLIGGEESGGIGFKNHIPERDAVLAALYILEMLAQTKQPLRALVSQLSKQVGPSYYDRFDIRLKEAVHNDEFEAKIKKQFRSLCDEKPAQTQDYDGVKFIWKDDRWLMFRLSGTEPVLRVYAESDTHKKTHKMLALAKHFLYNQIL